ncbi:hypothetical protein [Alteribacillus sp. YIM 98480]|uniref:hypothetical protein n=1 Tax=Alteribacillus sp. YIM 98480 TaxID=2606599 RepID=UPI00131C126E|nr:hypothetical protein [Alteribacillus sp. YIM 98480]
MKCLCIAETTLFEDDVVCYNIVCSIVKKVKRILLANRKQNFGIQRTGHTNAAVAAGYGILGSILYIPVSRDFCMKTNILETQSN